MRNEKGQYIKGSKPVAGFKNGVEVWNKGKKGIHLNPDNEFKKGSVPWNKGISMSDKQKKLMSEQRKGKHFSDKTEFKKGQSPWNKGKKWPERSGENHHNWKNGISKLKGYRTFNARRRRVRKRNNGGWHTLADWQNLKAQYNWTCPCCHKKEPEIKLTEDHIIPLFRGGSDNIENIQPLCFTCNTKKRTKIIKYD